MTDYEIGIDRPPGSLPLPEETKKVETKDKTTETTETKEPPRRPREAVPADLYADVPIPTERTLSAEEIAEIEAVPPSAGAYVKPETLLSGDNARVVRELQQANAPLATQLNYLKSEGIEVESLPPAVLEPIAREITEYNKLSGLEKYNKAIELGLIPSGAEYSGEISYITPTLAKEYEAFRKVNTELPDGSWVNTRQLLELRQISPVSYNILTNQGFDAYETYIAQLQTQPAGERRQLTIPTEQQASMIELGLQQGTVEIKESKDKSGFWAQVPIFWRKGVEIFTPWEEAKGETFMSYIKDTPKRLLSPDVPEQATLKAQYEAEQAAPAWAQILFGPTVQYDSKTDMYYPILKMETPDVSGKKGTVKQAAKVLTKVIEVNYNELLKPDVIKPQINWKAIVDSIMEGKAKTAADIAKIMSRPGIGVTSGARLGFGSTVSQAINKQSILEAVEAAARVRATQSAIGSGIIALIPQVNVPPIQWQPFKPSELTPTRMTQLVNQWKAMKPYKALEQIRQAHLTTIAISFDPDTISKILDKVNQKQRNKFLTTTKPEIKQAIDTGNLTQAQQLAQIETETAIQTSTITQQATELARELAQQQMTQQQIQTQVQTQVQQQVSNITNTKVQENVQTRLSQIISNMTPPVLPNIPLPRLPYSVSTVGETVTKIALMSGVIAFKMGALWKYYPPPYTSKKLYTLGKGQIPEGAVIGKSNRPEDTIQVIGTPPVRIPESISIDLGVVDIEIYNYGRNIRFAGSGEDTMVGTSIYSPTQGLSIPSIGLRTVRTPRKPKHKRRGKYDFSDIISMKGVRL